MARALLMMWLLSACSNAPKPGLDPALEARGVEAIRHFAAVYAENATDCEKLAAALHGWATTYVSTMQAIKDAVPAGEKNPWDGKHDDVFAELREKSKPALAKCGANRAVMKASQELRLD